MDSQPISDSTPAKQSAHAKRRMQKKLKKEAEQKAAVASGLFKYQEKKKSGASVDKTSDHSMTDETKPEEKKHTEPKKIFEAKRKVSEPAKEETSKPNEPAKNTRKNGGDSKIYTKDGVLKTPVFKSKEKPMRSHEKGFTGNSETWFDDEEYNKPKKAANFDKAGEHDYYFNSYSSHHIHEEMLKDTSRTLTYQQAIEGNPQDFKDKIVLDIGCGTGILSIFAARAGAKHVYAIDNAEVALFAKEIVKQNGFEDKITVFKGKVEDIELPVKEVDIIVSEWMGYFLLYESMLDCVLWARDKYLNKKTGKMLPDRAQMYVAAIEDAEYMAEKKNFWNNVYGVNMSVMSNGMFTDPVVDTVPAANIMSDSCCVLDLDLVKMKPGEVEFSNYFNLRMNFNDKVHALVVWFDTPFSRLTNPTVLSTAPTKKYTHWKQSVVYLEKPLSVRSGNVLYGSLACRQDRKNFRELNIKISYHLDNAESHEHFTQQYKFK